VRVGSAAVLATCGALITDAKGLLQAAAMQLALAGSSTIHEQGVRGRDGVGWPCHVERVRWSWVCDVMTHLMNGTSFVHADTTSHSTPRGPLAGELSTCASDSPGAPGPRRSDIRERRTQHTLLSKQVK
jgi:hypothetical protein